MFIITLTLIMFLVFLFEIIKTLQSLIKDFVDGVSSKQNSLLNLKTTSSSESEHRLIEHPCKIVINLNPQKFKNNINLKWPNSFSIHQVMDAIQEN